MRYRGWQDGLRVPGGLDVDGQPGGMGRGPERDRHCQITLQRPQGMQTPPQCRNCQIQLGSLIGYRYRAGGLWNKYVHVLNQRQDNWL